MQHRDRAHSRRTLLNETTNRLSHFFHGNQRIKKRLAGVDISGAEGRGRTGTAVKPSVFETDASANSATSATRDLVIIAKVNKFVKKFKSI